jgi:cell division protease FtsH
MSLPKDDMLNMRRKQAIDTIIMTMGGRISEEYVTDDISSGASMDIQQATELAKAMVMHWGMSEKLGNVLYGESQEYVFLGRDMMRTKEYSEATAEAIDSEVKRIVDESYTTATELIDRQPRQAGNHCHQPARIRNAHGAQVRTSSAPALSLRRRSRRKMSAR